MKRTALLLYFLLTSTISSFGQCWESVAVGYANVFAIADNGTLWAWGRNNFGQLGDGTTENRLVPTQIGTDKDWNEVQSRAFQATMITKSNGSVWYMGWNTFGGFGNGTYANSMTPTRNMNIKLIDNMVPDGYLASNDVENKIEGINKIKDNLVTAMKDNDEVAILDKK